jgi:hypothetical protein
MKAVVRTEDTIREVIPWVLDDYLNKLMEERRREALEVFEMLDSLALSEVPEEVKEIVKRPSQELLLVRDINP